MAPLSGGGSTSSSSERLAFEEVGVIGVGPEESLDRRAEPRVAAAGIVEVGGPLGGGELHGVAKTWLSFTERVLPMSMRRRGQGPPTDFKIVHLAFQPGLGIGPVGLGGGLRDAQQLGRLRQGEAGEVAEGDKSCPAGGRDFEAVEGFVQGKHVGRVRRGADGWLVVVEGVLLKLPAVAQPALATGLLDEDAAHGLGGGGEEVPATAPARWLIAPDQTEVGLVDQSGRLKRLAGLLLSQLRAASSRSSS